MTDLRYSAAIAVTLPVPPSEAYSALTNLGEHPKWNAGMNKISETGSMREGMTYETVTTVLGRKSRSIVTVEQLIPNQGIVLVNDSGLIAFRAAYRLTPAKDNQTEVKCLLSFDLKEPFFDLAKPAVESIARTRILGDLETLKAILMDKKKRP